MSALEDDIASLVVVRGRLGSQFGNSGLWQQRGPIVTFVERDTNGVLVRRLVEHIA